MLEVFVIYKLKTQKPKVLCSINDGTNIFSSFSFEALSTYQKSKNLSSLIAELMKKDQVKFMLLKSKITAKEINITDFPKEQLAESAFDLAKRLNFKYVTCMDILASFLLTLEPQTKLLFNKNLKEDEFLHILYWAHFDFPKEEIVSPTRVKFTGEGIGEGFVNGWTFETAKYIEDITAKVIAEKPILLGRTKEFNQITEMFNKDVKGNIILLGEPGSGKTALVQALAMHSFKGELKGNLYHDRFYELMLGTLLSGVENAGALEERLNLVMQEISHSGNIILYLPEIENITGASTFKTDLSGILLPYLRDSKIRIIGSTTFGAYKKFIEPISVFSDNFEKITIEEPDQNTAIQMLLERASSIEKKHKVELTYKAIVACVQFANHYVPDHVLPGSAVSLLSFVAGSAQQSKQTIVDEDFVAQKVQEKSGVAIAKPNQEEKDLLLNLEEKMHARIIGQTEGVKVIAEAIRRFRTGLHDNKKPMSFLFLGPTGVGKTETAKTLADLYFGGIDKMIRVDMSEYAGLDSQERLLGENGLVDKVREHPFSVVLLDEFEKANQDILNLFLQVFDDGRLTDINGKTVSFSDSIIIATSNAGSEFIREEISKGTIMDNVFQQKLLTLLQRQAIFKPELLNRFDGIVAFKPLGQTEIVEIIKLILNSLIKKMAQQDITISFDQSIIDKIAKDGFNAEFGARPIARYVQNNIEDLLAKKMLNNEIVRGAKVNLGVNSVGEIILTG